MPVGLLSDERWLMLGFFPRIAEGVVQRLGHGHEKSPNRTAMGGGLCCGECEGPGHGVKCRFNSTLHNWSGELQQ